MNFNKYVFRYIFILGILVLSLTACSQIAKLKEFGVGSKYTEKDASPEDTTISLTRPDRSSEFENEIALEVETIEGNHYIAIAAPLTGPYRELGKTIVEGANLAVEEFNEKQKGKNRIGTIIIDDGGLVSEGLGRSNIVIAQNCLGVIGHLNTEISVATSEKYAKAFIPEISPATTHPLFTERPNVRGYVFRTIGTDRQLGELAANYVMSHSNLKKIAVLYNDKAYGISVASEFVRDLAKDPSREIVFYETIPVRTHDHNATADKVASRNPDLVFFVGEYNDAGYLLKALKERLPELQFLASEGVHNPDFIRIAGGDSEGALIIGAEPPKEDMITKYREKYHKAVSAYAGTGYKATQILLEAIKANNFKDTKGIAKTIQENKIFDPNGDLIDPKFVLYKVVNSDFMVI